MYVYWAQGWAGQAWEAGCALMGVNIVLKVPQEGPGWASMCSSLLPQHQCDLLPTSFPWKRRVPGDGGIPPVCPAAGEHPFSLGGVKSPLPQQVLSGMSGRGR